MVIGNEKGWMSQEGDSPRRQMVADGVTRGATADYECERCIARCDRSVVADGDDDSLCRLDAMAAAQKALEMRTTAMVDECE